MSGRYSNTTMSGANNVPLGVRPQGPQGSSMGGGGGPSLLKPAYLQQGSSGDKIALAELGRGQETSLWDMNVILFFVDEDGGSANIPPLLVQTAGDDDKKRQALQTILNFNAEQARKRAASGQPVASHMPYSAAMAASFPPVQSRDTDSAVPGGNEETVQSGSAEAPGSERKRKRRSRWGGGEEDKTFIPGMPTIMPQGLTREQEEAYLCKL